MIRKLTVFAILLVPCFARGQYPYVPIVQAESGGGGTTSFSCVFDRNVTSGNIILIGFEWQPGDVVPAVADTLGTSFSRLAHANGTVSNTPFSPTPAGSEVWAGLAPSSGADTVTVTTSDGIGGNRIACAEFPPNWSLTPDTTDTVTYGVSTGWQIVSSNAFVTTKNHDLIFSLLGGPHAQSSYGLNGNGYMPVAESNNDGSAFAQWKVAGLAGSYTASFNERNLTGGFVITVALPPTPTISVTSPAVPDGVRGQAYSYQLQAAGGSGALSWSVTSGVLQPGLSLSTGGLISGTPTASSSNSITFRVTDGTNTATKSVSLKVAGSGNVNTIAHIQDQSPHSCGSGCTLGTSVTSGDLLLIAAWTDVDGPFSYCTDTLGTPFQLFGYTPSAALYSMPSLTSSIVFGGIAPASGTDTITCSGNNGDPRILEISNAQYFGDGISTSFGTGVTSGTVTISLSTVTANEELYGSVEADTGNATAAISSPFTQLSGGTATGRKAAYDAAGAAGSYTMSATLSGNNVGSGDPNALNCCGYVLALSAFRPTVGAVVASPVRHRAWLQ